MHLISKSSYVKGLQCRKALYLYKYDYNLKSEVSAGTQKLFDTGHLVGEMAKGLFPGGTDCGMDITRNAERSVEMTRKAIESDAKVIYEAAFIYNDILVLADLMVKRENGKWDVIEVKSSTSIKDYYYDDSSVQYYVISNYGIEINDISIAYVNNKYVKNGQIILKDYFTIVSLMDIVKEKQGEVENIVKKFREMLISKQMPVIDIGPHCNDPFECEYKNHCWQHIPEYSVFNIGRLGKRAFELYRKGILDVREIPEDFGLTEKQIIEKITYTKGTEYMDADGIRDYLKDIQYPLYFFDFETFMPAVPVWNGTRPYETIPFQYSLYYRESQTSEPDYFEFLADGKDDPRPALLERLLKETEREGTILAYNVGFERARMTEMAEAYPKYKDEIDKRINRLADLMTPFANKLYYKPSMKGRYSIKVVLPAINPGFDYSDLEIHEGGAASNEFERMISLKDEKEIQKIRNNLLDYCKRDTYAMIILLNELEKIAGDR